MKKSTRQMLLVTGTAAAGTAILYARRKPRYSGVKMKKTIIIDRPASDLYTFWRNFENLPRIASILESVEVLDAHRSRWTVNAPGEIPIQWDAEITKDIENEMIGWRSIEGSTIETAGYVRFEPAPGGRGTLVRVAMEYDLPAGRVGAAVATLFGKRPGAHVEELLHRFKQLMETGEVSVARRQPA
jgi:uncharacterized membrane protein